MNYEACGIEKHLFNILYNILGNHINIVGLYSPIGSALECEANVLRSIHNSGELKDVLRRPTTCSDRWALWTGEMSYS